MPSWLLKFGSGMPQQRKLATILALDVAGYSRAMERDDTATAEGVLLLRQVIAEIATPFGGRVFNTAGDGFMLEFPAASSGVQAAVALLRESKAGVRALPQIRIGLHMGEVIVAENGDLLGHGVNVAARLQALAEPGSAVVSDAVRQQVRSAAETPFTPQGRVQLDKMSEKIAVFGLSPNGRSAYGRILRKRFTSIAAAFAALLVAVALGWGAWSIWGPKAPAGAPLIAVLPFDSDTPETQAFADNFSAELLYAMTHSGQGLQVVSQNSSFSFRGADKKLPDIRKQLNVSHIIDGRVTRKGDEVTATVELVDVRTGQAIWRDRLKSDIGDTQTMIIRIMARARTALQLQATSETATAKIDRRALDLYLSAGLKGGSAYVENQRDTVARLEQAVQIQPDFARAWQKLTEAAYTLATYSPDSKEREEARGKALAASEKSRQLAPNDAESWIMAAFVVNDSDKASEFAARARQLDPLNSRIAARDINNLAMEGQGQEAYSLAERSFVLNPMDPPTYFLLIHASLMIGRTERADQLIRDFVPDGAADLWPSIIVSWLSRGDWSRAEQALVALDAAISAMEREANGAPTLAAIARRHMTDLRQVLAALRGTDAAAREATAKRIEARVRGVREEPDDAQSVYEVYLPALLALAGPERTFAAWAARLDALPRQVAPKGQQNAMNFEVAAWQIGGYRATLRPLQRDPRYWTMVAKLDPQALGVASFRAMTSDPRNHFPPDFCKEQGFPYDCRKVADAAFIAIDKARGLAE
jgi:adenylate cyclase